MPALERRAVAQQNLADLFPFPRIRRLVTSPLKEQPFCISERSGRIGGMYALLLAKLRAEHPQKARQRMPVSAAVPITFASEL
jgi:hypothetical protein